MIRPENDDDAPSLPRWSAVTTEWLLGALLIAGPLTLGATEAWGQIIVLPLIVLATIVVLAGIWSSPRVRVVGHWTYLPIALLLLVAIAGRAPLPTSLQTALAPGLTALRHELLSLAGRSVADSASISVYPLATERQLRLLLAGASLFFRRGSGLYGRDAPTTTTADAHDHRGRARNGPAVDRPVRGQRQDDPRHRLRARIHTLARSQTTVTSGSSSTCRSARPRR